MTVYVDELIDYGVTYGRAGPEWCHLTADTVDELHAFAARIGLQRSWFQGPPRHRIVHYDLTRGMRAKALRMGATFVPALDQAHQKLGPLMQPFGDGGSD